MTGASAGLMKMRGGRGQSIGNDIYPSSSPKPRVVSSSIRSISCCSISRCSISRCSISRCSISRCSISRCSIREFLHDMCGIIGLCLGNPASHAGQEILEGLWQLQHRGQDACGIATTGPYSLKSTCVKGKGLVSENFVSRAQVEALTGSLGVGHGEWRLGRDGRSAYGASKRALIFNIQSGIVREGPGWRLRRNQFPVMAGMRFSWHM